MLLKTNEIRHDEVGLRVADLEQEGRKIGGVGRHQFVRRERAAAAVAEGRPDPRRIYLRAGNA